MAEIVPLVWKISAKIWAIPRENFILAEFENNECNTQKHLEKVMNLGIIYLAYINVVFLYLKVRFTIGHYKVVFSFEGDARAYVFHYYISFDMLYKELQEGA